ncbi:hypothetical protein [Bordetella petrii]|uniref:hypothetical protein n=1 Tax=Bordetella petrii TaxID=94624 RepID=UPI001E2EC1D1|nr:hypothetical protein [Bordetella petrii]MCD0503675.1 hypothetical protein [Bordetella petrii]
MKTIAWYHQLAGEMSPAETAERLPFTDIGLATIYRYRLGEISPRAELLEVDDPAFNWAREAYEVGPRNVPLWDAMWGSLTPADFKLADKVMPAGDWSSSVTDEIFFDDLILARITGFRQRVVRVESVTSDLEALVAAIRVARSWGMLGTGNPLALRVLLEGTMALPGARGLLEQFGLQEPMSEWIATLFHGTAAEQQRAAYWAAWMDNDELYFNLCQLADLRKAALRRSAFGRPAAEFERMLITDPLVGESAH